jgi:signal transduction histidine kinase
MNPDTEGATVLVVDDNPSKRYAISRLLRGAGYRTREAGSGQQALDEALAAPDLIVLDVNLPDIDGFEVCRLLREREKQTAMRTPIIHLSATFVEDTDKVHGLEVGADGYLTHPVEAPVLIATVNAFIRARRAEEGMRRSEDRFRAVFDRALHGIALLGDDLSLQEANAALRRMLDGAGDFARGTPWAALVGQEGAARASGIRASLADTGEWQGVLTVVRADGSDAHLEWAISRHASTDLWIAMVADMTQRLATVAERERLHESERAARTEAERANRLKDDFLATVSHELRSPLNAIVGWAQLLLQRPSEDPVAYRDAMAAILRNGRLQAQLITDLLDVSRITAGKLRLEMASVDLAAIVRHAVEGQAEAARARGIALSLVDGGQAWVSGDAGRLAQVVSNLISNALKFTSAGGKVEVRLEVGEAVVLTVRDTGRGIAAEFLAHVFDSFRQEDAGLERRHEGLGLGLSIVKRLVELQGGSVRADSPGLGHGSIFTVRLPRASAEVAPQAPPGPVPRPLGGQRILVVDDDPDARLFVMRLLEDHAVDVREADNAGDALAIVLDWRPQLLISDISMPGEDGLALLRRIRAAGIGPDTMPAIALTAFARPDERAVTLANGFQAHLAKPVELERLLGAIIRLSTPAD